MNESTVYLQKTESGAFIEASLFDQVTDDHLAMWRSKWVPVLKMHSEHLAARNAPEDAEVPQVQSQTGDQIQADHKLDHTEKNERTPSQKLAQEQHRARHWLA